LLSNFAPLTEHFYQPSHFSSAVIFVSQLYPSYLDCLFKQLEVSNCHDIALVFENYFDSQLLRKNISTSGFENIEIYINKNYLKDLDEIIQIWESEPRINNIFIFNFSHDTIIVKDDLTGCSIIGVSQPFNVAQNYISNSEHYFQVTIDIYMEALRHNLFYNKKIFIDGEGTIYNDVNLTKEFGNITQINDLKALSENADFTWHWHIPKTEIDICKHCEFRYLCLDSRVPIKRESGGYYHELECNYNPFICKWKGENEYLTLKEVGVVSNSEEYTIDYEKLKTINNILWGS